MNNTTNDIILLDGTVIHTTLNGNNYITNDVVNLEILSDDNLSKIVIDGMEYNNMTCTNLWEEDGSTRFILRELTEIELLQKCFIELSSLL